MRTYKASRSRLASSHRVFYDHVLPLHLKHGARFIGRWLSDDDRIIVIWEYDSRADCERVQTAVREDPDTVATADLRRDKGLLDANSEEILMTSTGWEPNQDK